MRSGSATRRASRSMRRAASCCARASSSSASSSTSATRRSAPTSAIARTAAVVATIHDDGRGRGSGSSSQSPHMQRQRRERGSIARISRASPSRDRRGSAAGTQFIARRAGARAVVPAANARVRRSIWPMHRRRRGGPEMSREAGPLPSRQRASRARSMMLRSLETTRSRATRLSPPSGMMRSARRLEGSTNWRCIGRTWR